MSILTDEIKAGRLNAYAYGAELADTVVPPTTYSEIEKTMEGGLRKRLLLILMDKPMILVLMNPRTLLMSKC